MAIWQQPRHLSMLALGTNGGQPRVDGSQLEAGIHLRWNFNHRLGFPPGGFNLYRRPHNPGTKHCGWLYTANGGSEIRSENDNLQAHFRASGDVQHKQGCGRDYGIFLDGEQTFRIDLAAPARHVEIILDASTPPRPEGHAFWESHDGAVQVDFDRANRVAQQSNHWRIQLYADRIDHVLVQGTDMLICRVCVVLMTDALDMAWTDIPINGLNTPIHLPVTHPQWPGVHPHQPDDPAEALARLPGGLDPQLADAYVAAFKDDTHGILYDLVGTPRQHRFRIDEAGTNQGAAPAPSRLQWPGIPLLQLTSLDPNQARILGLYWHDSDVKPGRFYDYLLEGIWDDVPFPGKDFEFSRLPLNSRYTAGLLHNDLAILSPNPLTVVEALYRGEMRKALLCEAIIPHAPLALGLPEPVRSITLHLNSAAGFTITGYLGAEWRFEESYNPGEQRIVIEQPNPVNRLQIQPDGQMHLFLLAARKELEPIGRIYYVSFRRRAAAPPAVLTAELDPPTALPGRTGLDALEGLVQQHNAVGLRWSRHPAGSGFLRPNAPVFFHVGRSDLGDSARTGAPQNTRILNEDTPTLLSAEGNEVIRPEGWPAERPYYIDRDAGDGWYGYRVRGIDLFGRLGPWSNQQNIQVLDRVPPPPPIQVAAVHLHPQDPYLAAADVAHAPGFRVSWEWSGMQRLQSPDVEQGGEFRIYLQPGELNLLQGQVTTVTDNGGGTTRLVTNGYWRGADDELAGEWVRVNQTYFQILKNTSGQDFELVVENLANPTEAPQPGRYALALSPERPYTTDYRNPANWTARLGVEPAGSIPLLQGQVSAVTAAGGGLVEVATDAAANANEDLTPGALVVNGVAYLARAHSLDGSLSVQVLPQEIPTDPPQSPPEIVQPQAGDAFAYLPGKAYQVYLPDVGLERDPSSGTAVAHLAVSTSDGKAHTPDDPRWDRSDWPDRPGNEGDLSAPQKIVLPDRSVPPAPGNVPVATQTPIYARPADFYGQAQYTLTWEAVNFASGYGVYRCSGAALFSLDQQQRRDGSGYYAAQAPFADDPGFETWLFEHYPNLSAAALTPGAWRAWADRFYPALSDADVQALADRPGNEAAFRRINQQAVETTSYTDRFEGRGQGFYLYRVRSINAAGTQSDWAESLTHPPVHIYDVTPPAAPMVTAVTGGDRRVTIQWRPNPEPDLEAYRIWRAESPEALRNPLRLAPLAEPQPAANGEGETWTDDTLEPVKDYFYRLAAVDARGNVSQPTAVFMGRAYDAYIPPPPVWQSPEVDPAGNAVTLHWSHADPGLACLVQRRVAQAGDWFSISTWLPRGQYEFTDTDRETPPYQYRLLVSDPSGRQNTTYDILEV